MKGPLKGERHSFEFWESRHRPMSECRSLGHGQKQDFQIRSFPSHFPDGTGRHRRSAQIQVSQAPALDQQSKPLIRHAGASEVQPRQMGRVNAPVEMLVSNRHPHQTQFLELSKLEDLLRFLRRKRTSLQIKSNDSRILSQPGKVVGRHRNSDQTNGFAPVQKCRFPGSDFEVSHQTRLGVSREMLSQADRRNHPRHHKRQQSDACLTKTSSHQCTVLIGSHWCS